MIASLSRPRIRACAIACAILATSLVAVEPLAAQRRGQATADTLIQLARSRAEKGDTAAALDLLQRATRTAPDYAPAFYERGVLLARTTQLGMSDVWRRHQAGQELKRALDLDSGNPFYLMELGRLRLKTPFLRLDAERLFKKALRAAEERGDPVVLADVQFELGQIYERRYQSTADRRLIVGGGLQFDPAIAVSDWRYTRDFLEQRTQKLDFSGELDFRKAEDAYRAAIAADPAHRGAAVGLLGLLYETDRYEEMLRVAEAARTADPRNARVRLAEGLALHRLDRDVDAGAAFDTALALLPPAERRDMTGLESILRAEDAARYRKESEAMRLAHDSLYWDVSDPVRLTPVNEARIEFLARVAFADLRFTSDEFHVKGWRSDRGVIVARYGEPPVVATFAPESENIEGSDGAAKVTTVWHYAERNRTFVFYGPPAMNYAAFAGDFRSYADNARHVEPVSFENLAPRLRVDSVPVQVARFRGETPTAVDVSVFADLPTRRMLKDVDVAQVSLETALFLSDGQRRDVATLRDSAFVRADARDPVVTRSWQRVLAPGEYQYRVEAREPVSGHSARGRSTVVVEPFTAGVFALSDVLLADRIVPRAGAAPRDRGDYFIVPNASLTYQPGDTIFLYWEAYGLSPDSLRAGRMRVDIGLRLQEVERAREFTARILGGIADAVGLSEKGDDRVSLRFERTVALDSSDRVPNYLALALGDAPAGTYQLELTVTDLTTGKSTTRTRTIRVPLS
jgi:GWxTD domain-containing protein